MSRFGKMQSIALWLHIPLWIMAGLAIVIMGAYNAGAGQWERKEQVIETISFMQEIPIIKTREL